MCTYLVLNNPKKALRYRNEIMDSHYGAKALFWCIATLTENEARRVVVRSITKGGK
jgi:hypothetical protein